MTAETSTSSSSGTGESPAVHSMLRTKLERMEVESPGCVVPFEVYGQLLAVYLYDNDLCAAKFLWKRIPENIKSEHPELKKIWDVGVALWERNLPGVYTALNQTWSEGVSQIMEAVKVKTRSRFVDLVSQAYSTISLSDFSNFVGLDETEASKLAENQSGWSYDSANKIIHPAKVEIKETESVPSERQLHLLTDFVAFLEK